MKKGQGLSMNTIIIAALALLVLIIIALIFTGRVRLFRTGIEDCVNQGGQCVLKQYCKDSTDRNLKQMNCDTNYVCCVTSRNIEITDVNIPDNLPEPIPSHDYP